MDRVLQSHFRSGPKQAAPLWHCLSMGVSFVAPQAVAHPNVANFSQKYLFPFWFSTEPGPKEVPSKLLHPPPPRSAALRASAGLSQSLCQHDATRTVLAGFTGTPAGASVKGMIILHDPKWGWGLLWWLRLLWWLWWRLLWWWLLLWLLRLLWILW